jgi:hypothetical protein
VSNNPNSSTAAAQVQTLVVHVEQLTPDNMAQLSQAGYSIMRDPSLLIFGRTVPAPQNNPMLQMVPQGEQEELTEGQ